MPVIPKAEYDRFYFGDVNEAVGEQFRPSGYSPGTYNRYPRGADIRNSTTGELVFTSTGELFQDIAEFLAQYANLPRFTNIKVLELGCAKGFLVEDLRRIGIDIVGIDISQWAISQAPSAAQPFVSAADALTYLQAQRNNLFDYIVSLRFIECIEPITELPQLVTQMNRVGRKQVHVIDEEPNPDYYNAMTLEQYRANYAWKAAGNTILLRYEDFAAGIYNPKQVVVTT